MFTVLVAHCLTDDEKMTLGRVSGIGFGFTGVSFLVGADALQGAGTDRLAPFAVLAAALSYAFAGVFGRRFRAWGIPPLVAAAGQLRASAALMIPLALVTERPWSLPMPRAEVWGAVAGLALCSTALAYTLYFRILATAGATNVVLVTFLIPVSAILLGTTILGEELAWRHFIGMGFIGLGLAAVDGRVVRRLGRPTRAPHLPSPGRSDTSGR